jgi:hypothetical protein
MNFLWIGWDAICHGYWPRDSVGEIGSYFRIFWGFKLQSLTFSVFDTTFAILDVSSRAALHLGGFAC